MAHAKGLRDRRVMTRYAGRNAILPPLNGFAALFASAVGGLVFIEFVFSYPGAGFTLQQAALGADYPLTQGAAVRVRGLRDRREPDHGHPQRGPRPARADRITVSGIQPITVDRPGAAAPVEAPSSASRAAAAGSTRRSGSLSCGATRSRGAG